MNKKINIEEMKRYLKRSLKNKVRITTSLVMLFLMTNSVSYSDNLTINKGSIYASGEPGKKSIALNPEGENGKIKYTDVSDYSVVIGNGAKTKDKDNGHDGKYGVAIGYEAESLGEKTVAIGNKAISKASGSVVIGHNAISEKGDSVVIGKDAKNELGTEATAIGVGTKADGDKSVAVGYHSKVSIDEYELRSEMGKDYEKYVSEKNPIVYDPTTGKKMSKDEFAKYYVADDKHLKQGYEHIRMLNGVKQIEYDKGEAAGQGVAIGSQAVSTEQAVSLGNDTYALGRSSIAIGNDDNALYRQHISAYDYQNYFKKLYDKLSTKDNNFKYGYANKGKGEEINPGQVIRERAAEDQDTSLRNRRYSPTLAAGHGSIAIGSRSLAYGSGSTAFGTLAFALKYGSTAIGSETRAEGIGAIAVGRKTNVFSDNSVSIGNETTVLNEGGMAYGYKAYSGGKGSIAIGTEVYSNVEMDYGKTFEITMQGNKKQYVTPHDVPNGGMTNGKKTESAYQFDLNGVANTAPDNKYLESGEYFTNYNGTGKKGYLERLEEALTKWENDKENGKRLSLYTKTELHNGVQNVVKQSGKNSIVIGSLSAANGDNSLALGRGAFGRANNAFAIGSYSYALKDNSMAFGVASRSLSKNALAFGVGSGVDINSDYSMSIGAGAVVHKGSKNALAFGSQTRVAENAESAIAFGNNAYANLNNSIALGVESKTDYTKEELEKNGWVPRGILATPSTQKVGVISVGKKGAERRIVNVASGYRDSDAVNVAQLRALEEKLNQNGLLDLKGSQMDSGVHYLSVNKDGKDDIKQIMQKQKDYQDYVEYKSKYLEALAKKNIRQENSEALTKYINELKKKVDELEKKNNNDNIKNSELKKISDSEMNGNDFDSKIEKIYQAKIKDKYDSDGETIKNILTDAEKKKIDDSNFTNKGAKGKDSIALGYKAQTGEFETKKATIGNSSTSVETHTGKNGKGAVAIGKEAVARGNHTIALGEKAGVYSIKHQELLGNIGVTTTEHGSDKGIAIGYESRVDGKQGIAIGTGEDEQGLSDIDGADLQKHNAAVRKMKNNKTSSKEYAVAIGTGARADENSVSLGRNTTSGQDSVSIGKNVHNKGNKSIAIGDGAKVGLPYEKRIASGTNVAIKTYGDVEKSIALGNDAHAQGNSSIAIGDGAMVGKKTGNSKKNNQDNNLLYYEQGTLADKAVAIGHGAKAEENESIAIGKDAKSTHTGSVAIGMGSEAKSSTSKAYLTETMNDGGKTFAVGSSSVKRRITGVADGAEDSDVVTVAQLKKVTGGVGSIKLQGDNSTTPQETTFDLTKKIEIKGSSAKKANNNNEVETWNQNDDKHTVENVQTFVTNSNGSQKILIGIKENPRFGTIKLGSKGSVTLTEESGKLKVNTKVITGLSNGTSDNDAATYGQVKKATEKVEAETMKTNEKALIEVTSADGTNGLGKTYTVKATDELKNKIKEIDKKADKTDLDSYVKKDASNLDKSNENTNRDKWISKLGTDDGIINPNDKLNGVNKGKGRLITEQAFNNYMDNHKIKLSADNNNNHELKLGERIEFLTNKTGNAGTTPKTFKVGTTSADQVTYSTKNLATYIEEVDDGKAVNGVQKKKKQIFVGISENPEFDTVKVGKTDIVTLSSTSTGLSLGNKKIENLADGTISSTSTDAITGKQLDGFVKELAGNTDITVTKDNSHTSGGQKYKLSLSDSIKNKINKIDEKADKTSMKFKYKTSTPKVNGQTTEQELDLNSTDKTLDFKAGSNLEAEVKKGSIEYALKSDLTGISSVAGGGADNKSKVILEGNGLKLTHDNATLTLTKDGTNKVKLSGLNENTVNDTYGTTEGIAATQKEVKAAKDSATESVEANGTEIEVSSEDVAGKGKKYKVGLSSDVKSKLESIKEKATKKDLENYAKVDGSNLTSTTEQQKQAWATGIGTSTILENPKGILVTDSAVKNYVDSRKLMLEADNHTGHDVILGETFEITGRKIDGTKGFDTWNVNNLTEKNGTYSTENVETFVDRKGNKTSVLVGIKETPTFKNLTIKDNDNLVKFTATKDALTLNTKKISGVSDGVADTDVVNMSQLNSAKEDVKGTTNYISVTSTGGTGKTPKTFTVDLDNSVKTKLSEIGTGEVSGDHANKDKTVTGKKVHDAIEKAKKGSTETVSQGDGIKVTATNGKNGAGKDYKVELEDGLKAKINGALQKTEAETTYAKIDGSNVKGLDDTKKKAWADGIGTSTIGTDNKTDNHLVTAGAVKTYVNGKGLTFKSDFGNELTKTLGSTLEILGGRSTSAEDKEWNYKKDQSSTTDPGIDYTTENVMTKEIDGKIFIGLKKNPKFDSIKINDKSSITQTTNSLDLTYDNNKLSITKDGDKVKLSGLKDDLTNGKLSNNYGSDGVAATQKELKALQTELKGKITNHKGSIEEVEAKNDSPITVTSEDTTTGKKFKLDLDKSKAVTKLSNGASILGNNQEPSLVTDVQVKQALESAKEEVKGKDYIEVTSTNGANGKGKTFTVGLNSATKTKIDEIGMGEINSSESKTVTGGKVYTAIKNSKTKVELEPDEEILELTSVTTNNLTASNYKLKLNKGKITELIDVKAGANEVLEVKTQTDNSTNKKTFTVDLKDDVKKKINEVDEKANKDASNLNDITEDNKKAWATNIGLSSIDTSKNADTKNTKLVTGKAVTDYVKEQGLKFTADNSTDNLVKLNETLSIVGKEDNVTSKTWDVGNNTDKTHSTENVSTLFDNTNGKKRIFVGIKERPNFKEIKSEEKITLGKDNGIEFTKDTDNNLKLNNKKIKGLSTDNITSATYGKDTNAGIAATQKEVKEVLDKINDSNKTSTSYQTIVYTDENGNKLVKDGDNFYKLNSNGEVDKTQSVTKDKVELRATNGSDTNTPISLGNVKSSLGITKNIKNGSNENADYITEAKGKVKNLLSMESGLDKVVTLKDLQAVAKTGLTFKTNLNSDEVRVPLGNSLTIKGDMTTASNNKYNKINGESETFSSAQNNIFVEKDKDNSTLLVKLAKQLQNIETINLHKVNGGGNDDKITLLTDGKGKLQLKVKESKTNGDKEEVTKNVVTEDQLKLKYSDGKTLTNGVNKIDILKDTLTIQSKSKYLDITTKKGGIFDINVHSTDKIAYDGKTNMLNNSLTTEKAVVDYVSKKVKEVEDKGFTFEANFGKGAVKDTNQVTKKIGEVLSITATGTEIGKFTNGSSNYTGTNLATYINNGKMYIGMKEDSKFKSLTIGGTDFGSKQTEGKGTITADDKGLKLGYDKANIIVSKADNENGANPKSKISGLKDNTVTDSSYGADGVAATQKEVKSILDKVNSDKKEVQDNQTISYVYEKEDGNNKKYIKVIKKGSDFYEVEESGKETKLEDKYKSKILLAAIDEMGQFAKPMFLTNIKNTLGENDYNLKKLSEEKDNKVLSRASSMKDLQELAKEGLTFETNGGKTQQKLGSTLKIVGEENKTLNGTNSDNGKADFEKRFNSGNVATMVEKDGTIRVGIKKDFEKVNSLTSEKDDTDNTRTKITLGKDGATFNVEKETNGNTQNLGSTTKINQDGISITKKDGKTPDISIKAENNGKGPSIDFATENSNGDTSKVKGKGSISGLKDLDENSAGHMAANKNYVDEQVKKANNQFNNKINEVEKKIDNANENLNKGYTFKANAGTANKKLGSTVGIVGGATLKEEMIEDTSSYIDPKAKQSDKGKKDFNNRFNSGNVATRLNEDNNIEIGIAKDLKDMKSFEAKGDKSTTKLDSEGLKISNTNTTNGDKSELNITNKEISFKKKDGTDSVKIDSEKGTITGVVTGETSDSAVNKGYVDDKIKDLDTNKPFRYFEKKEGKYGTDGKIYSEEVVIAKDGKAYEKGTLITSDDKIYKKGTQEIDGKYYDEDTVKASDGKVYKKSEIENKKYDEKDKKWLDKDGKALNSQPTEASEAKAMTDEEKVKAVKTAITEREVVKGKDGKFYAKDDLNGKTYDEKTKKYNGEVKDVDVDKIRIKAQPNEKAMTLSNIGKGKIEENSTDAINGGQLHEELAKKLNVDGSNIKDEDFAKHASKRADISKPNNVLVTDKQVADHLTANYYNKESINKMINIVDKKADKAIENSTLALGGVANAVAMANLVQVSSNSTHRHSLSAAYGYYGKSHALAIGFSGINKENNFVYKLSGSVNNQGNLALGIGAGLMLGETNDYKERKDTNLIKQELDEANKKIADYEEKQKKSDEKIKSLEEKQKESDNRMKELEKKLELLLKNKK